MKSADKNNSKTRGHRGKQRSSPNKPAGADRLVVRKWGNSAGLRIPMNIMRAAKLELDQEVEARVEDGALVVKPVSSQRKYVLKDLLDRITPENRHELVETAPVGKEVW